MKNEHNVEQEVVRFVTREPTNRLPQEMLLDVILYGLGVPDQHELINTACARLSQLRAVSLY